MTRIIQGLDSLIIGIDVGSTTVKATVVNPESKQILWSDYQRHHTKQAEKVLELLVAIGNEFPDVTQEKVRIFATGSGSGPIAPLLGAKFIQEVNAVTMAVEHLHPNVGSVIELGGQDAKIIIFKENAETGHKQALTSMNDKCASGTGAMIDKCMIKVGMPVSDMGKLHFDDSKLHHVAAKCGVFAETDIVNLVKTGVPSSEIMCSLADAIVMQNLSILTRGNTLRHCVLLLGGPNTYLTFLQECWRKRIPETWQERGYNYPKDRPIEDMILVPENSQYYAAYGAVLYGMHESIDVGLYLGVKGLKEFIAYGRKVKLSEHAGPPLVNTEVELEQFRRNYTIPRFTPASFTAGRKVRAVIGLDGGSTSSKAVLIDDQGELLLKEYQLSKGNPLEDTKEMLMRIREKVKEADVEIIGFGATGYAADILERTLKADVNIVETVAHMKSAVHEFGDIDVICDIGGQDIKVLFLKNRDIRNFKLSNQCSAGNGMLLQAMADQFGIPIQEYADTAFSAGLSPNFSYGCAVFLDADRVNFQKEGYSKEELLAGLALVLPKNVWQYVVQIPRMAELGRKFVLQGGTQYNLAAVKTQVDYIKQRVPDAEVYVHPHSGEAGAIGTAMETLRVVNRQGYSSFVGLNAAIELRYTNRNDESTRCQFCPNHCSRSFIDSETPDGQTARYISGFSCEKGTVEDKESVVKLTRYRNELKKLYPNLVEYEARRMFQHFYNPEPLPEPELVKVDVQQKRGWFGLSGRLTKSNQREFARSSIDALKKRNQIRIGIPRVLSIWSTAPFWRTYFETLGIDRQNIVFSDQTSEEMWQEGGKYGSIDPCYPSKVAQAHVHNLLFKCHEKKTLDYIFFPCITHIPTPLKNIMDSSSCPIVAGAPNVIKAAFTKEVNFFESRGIIYLDPAVTFTEPNMMKKQLYEAFAEHLQFTADESDFAIEQGWKAMNLFDAEMEEKGRIILEQVEQDNRLAILMIGRPYHSDPGLNHSVLEEFQVLGYPILSIRSIPKDESWLHRFFSADLKSGRVEHALEVSDVWPENFSSNSVQKVWAAKFAARHPNVAVLDLSSFKCGHDAPTYGLIDSIISAARTPYSALHDIDANKPSGSINIRVKTYAHSLRIHEERLQDLARKKLELQQRLEQKSAELLERKQDEQAGAI